MKRTERRHLKENELAHLAQSARDALETSGSQAWLIMAAVVAVLVVGLGYVGWRGSVQSRANALLAEALAVEGARVGPPAAPGAASTGLSFITEREKYQAALTKFKLAADQYPSTDAGLFARYRQATTYLALGNLKEAVDTYQQVIDRAGNSLHGLAARLGQAQAQARAGQFDTAITSFTALSQDKDGPLPIDGILMQLGQTYLQAGKTTDAQQTFNRLITEFPESAFSGDARRELDNLKKT